MFAGDLTLYFLSWRLMLEGGWAGVALSYLLLVLALTHSYLILHEAIHRSVSGRKWLNDGIGHVCGWIIGLPFLPRQRNHLLHHVWAAHPTRDPENSKLIERFAVMTEKQAFRVELFWRSWLPLIALNHFVATWWSPFEKKRAGSSSGRYTKEIRWAWRYVGAYALVALVLLKAGAVLLFVSWFIPAWIVLLEVVELLNLPHHGEAPLLAAASRPLPYHEQHVVSRDCGGLPFWSSFVILNFNRHIVHHHFPAVPWYGLPAAERLVRGLKDPGAPHVVPKHEFAWALTNRRRSLLEVMGHFFDKRTGNCVSRRSIL